MISETARYLIPVYATYAFASVSLTVWLARTLFRNGAVFLESVFGDDTKMADAVNRLLVVGFYLLNFGYACLLLKADPASNPVEAIEIFSWKLGALLLSLGGMHFCNMYLFYRVRRRSQIKVLPPPVRPQMRLADAPVPAAP
ncbi:MAG TPA: hypothetical protein VNO21_08270 [Polyangiaceae bacterium]|nr:hypothetical protein [Polyangiaceae bacterium]